jgi:L-fuconolactonase
MTVPHGAIDAHHHLWNFSEREYPWIDPSMTILRRDFTVADFTAAAHSAGIEQSIVVQARQSMEETEWLLDRATEEGPVVGVIGWVPLCNPSLEAKLERISDAPALVGVRHVIHDEPDEQFILRSDFNAGISLLDRFNLAYDILIREKHLPQTITFVKRHPEQRFVVDHIAKPRIREGSFDRWAAGIRELARNEQVFCKVSGMVTEADWASWTVTDLQRYIDVVLEAFGPERTLFGSDWPVCLVAGTYQRWVSAVTAMTDGISDGERDWLFRRSAMSAYRIEER